jgi:hypothetical protein
MDKDSEKLQADLRIAAAFLKAHEEVRANESERQKRIYEQAVIAAENRCRKMTEEKVTDPKEPSEAIKAVLKKNCRIDI